MNRCALRPSSMNLCVLRRLTSIRVYISDKPGALRPSLVNLSGNPANTHTMPSGDLIHVCRQFGPVFLVPLRGIFKYGSTSWNGCKDLIQTKQACKQTCLFYEGKHVSGTFPGYLNILCILGPRLRFNWPIVFIC